MTVANGTLTVNSVGGLIDFEGSILGTSDEVLVLNANAATDGASSNEKVIVAAIGSGNQIHSVNITGRDGITLEGNITTSNKSSNNVSLTGPVAINAATVVIDTNAAGNDGTVTFSSTIDSATGTSRNLDLVSGAAKITVDGAIGGTTALATLDVNCLLYTSDAADE